MSFRIFSRREAEIEALQADPSLPPRQTRIDLVLHWQGASPEFAEGVRAFFESARRGFRAPD